MSSTENKPTASIEIPAEDSAARATTAVIDDILQKSLDQNKDQQIAAILVVGFHHAFGPIVEFCVPPLPPYHEEKQTTLEKLELPEEWSFLPFLALPGKMNAVFE